MVRPNYTSCWHAVVSKYCTNCDQTTIGSIRCRLQFNVKVAGMTALELANCFRDRLPGAKLVVVSRLPLDVEHALVGSHKPMYTAVRYLNSRSERVDVYGYLCEAVANKGIWELPISSNLPAADAVTEIISSLRQYRMGNLE